MDMRKVFDTIEFESLLDVLRVYGITHECIVLLQQLYSGQIQSVEDITFNIQYEVKQDDVLSSIFFNYILDIIFERWKSRLTNEELIIDPASERLTNIRYTDDILLYVKSLMELQYMTELLIEELVQIGLVLNIKKTTILLTAFKDDGYDTDVIVISNEMIEFLSSDKFHRYLGIRLHLDQRSRSVIEFMYRKQ